MTARRPCPPYAMLLLLGALCLLAGLTRDGIAGTEVASGAPPLFSGRQLVQVGRELGAREPLTGAAILGAAALLVSPRDEAWVEWASETEPLGPSGRDVGYWMNHRYTVGTQILALTSAGLLLREQHLRDTGLLLLQAQGLSAGLTQILKVLTDRPRPDDSNRRAFPSGHATAAWTTAVVLQDRYGPWLGVPAHAVALYVGLSRMQDSKHHLSDVLAGFGVAQWTARVVLRSAQPGRSRRVGWLRPCWSDGTALALMTLRF